MPDIVTFDPINLRIIEISTGTDNSLDWIEIYSEWKDWLLADSSRLGYPPAFRVVGGDPISNVQNLGSTFFLLAPWKFRPAEHNHRLTLVGNIFTDPAGQSPIVPTLGNFQVVTEYQVSTLVEASVAEVDLVRVAGAVYLDTSSGSDANGGTIADPVQTVNRAFVVAAAAGVTSIHFRGTFNLDRNAVGWSFVGYSDATSTFNLGGFDVAGAHFASCEIAGVLQGRITATDCTLTGVTNLDGVFRSCGFGASLSTDASSTIIASQCYSAASGASSTVLTLGATSTLSLRGWAGAVQLNSVTAGSLVSLDMNPGRCTLDASCTGGTVLVRGLSQIVDNSTGTTVIQDGLLQSELANQASIAVALAAR